MPDNFTEMINFLENTAKVNQVAILPFLEKNQD